METGKTKEVDELRERLLNAIKAADSAYVIWRGAQDKLNAAEERLRKAKAVGQLNPNAKNDAEIENAINWFEGARRVENDLFERAQDDKAEVARLRALLKDAQTRLESEEYA